MLLITVAEVMGIVVAAALGDLRDLEIGRAQQFRRRLHPLPGQDIHEGDAFILADLRRKIVGGDVEIATQTLQRELGIHIAVIDDIDDPFHQQLHIVLLPFGDQVAALQAEIEDIVTQRDRAPAAAERIEKIIAA